MKLLSVFHERKPSDRPSVRMWQLLYTFLVHVAQFKQKGYIQVLPTQEEKSIVIVYNKTLMLM